MSVPLLLATMEDDSRWDLLSELARLVATLDTAVLDSLPSLFSFIGRVLDHHSHQERIIGVYHVLTQCLSVGGYEMQKAVGGVLAQVVAHLGAVYPEVRKESRRLLDSYLLLDSYALLRVLGE